MTEQSGILTLENLEQEYQNTMILYKQAQENYNSALNSMNNKNYITISEKTYWGTGEIKQENVTNINECAALCSNDSKCKGATFDASNNTCWTRSGNSSLTNGTSTQSAIISEVMDALLNLQELNSKLLSIGDSINNFTFDNGNDSQMEYGSIMSNIKSENDVIKSQYGLLIIERQQIRDILNDFSTMNMDNQNMKLYNIQNRTYYFLWTFLSLIFFLIIIKMIIYPDMVISWGHFIFYTFVAGILLLLVHFLRYASLFFIFLAIIAIIGFLVTNKE
jgi:hypothetical protein